MLKQVNGHIVSVEYSEDYEAYMVYIDSRLIGQAITVDGVRALIDKYFREEPSIPVFLDPGAYVPERAHPSDAGLDLCSPGNFWLHPDKPLIVDTGVHIGVPPGYVGLITSKSGLMAKGITSRGTIDAGYTGSIKAVLYNSSGEGYQIKAGDKITQLVVVPCWTGGVEIVAHLDETDRGAGGFGSTGR